jgi:L-amino acid N-acyltransferase YncA
VISIREAKREDEDAIWSILKPMIRAGETYALPRSLTREEALAYWHGSGNRVFVPEEGSTVLGTYILRANHSGGGSHVANCGYVTAPSASGRGVAGAMCADSLARAALTGFRAMQFNFVVSTNERAESLWKRHGFVVVGTLPNAFLHPSFGYVDVFIMFRSLD